jgi:hypothetical protein
MRYLQKSQKVVSKMGSIVVLIMNVIYYNIALGITNPRIMLLENIRQSCIYYLHPQDISIYWQYMELFAESCADVDRPSFNEQCSKDVMKYAGIDSEEVNKCMKQQIISIL